jgi:serine/threonine-protein kinase RsbT
MVLRGPAGSEGEEPSAIVKRLREILERFLSVMTTESVLRRALRDANLTAAAVDAASFPRLRTQLELGIRMFVAPERQESLRRELGNVARAIAASALDSKGRSSRPPGPPDPAGAPVTKVVPIRLEADISHARLLARSLCADLSVKSLTIQKIATIVSELARNIISYTAGGVVELEIVRGGRPRFLIRAIDEGHGIPNLDEILGGQYKSKTGLGKGILGVKRLADAFDVKTSNAGTRVHVEVALI